MSIPPPMVWPRAATEARVPPIAQWTFIAFFLFTLLNVAALIQRLWTWDSIPIQPVAFLIAAAIIFPLTRSKPLTFYFVVAWIYWLLFIIGGFVGPDCLVSFRDKALIQLVFKLWISLLGMPLMLLRTIPREKLPMVVKLGIVGAACGGVFSIMQIVFRAQLGVFSTEPGRGAGFWIDANSCAHVLTFFLFLSFAFPFRSKGLNLVVRTLIVLGILSTLSRTGLVLLPVGLLVYAISARRIWTFFQVGGALAAVVIAANILVTLLQPDSGAGSMIDSEKAGHRLNRFTNLLQGKFGDSERNDRMYFWSHGWEAIMKEPFLGRGHRFMDSIAPVARDLALGPHNYYLYVWGNSGILALAAYVAFLVTLWRMGKRSTNTAAKPAMQAITAVMACIALVDHAVMGVQFLGCVLAIMVGVHYYYRPIKSLPAAVRYPIQGFTTEPRSRGV